MHLNTSIAAAASWCTFPLHSVLADEALCILWDLSVPHSWWADLIISVPLYSLKHNSSQFVFAIGHVASFSTASHPFLPAFLAVMSWSSLLTLHISVHRPKYIFTKFQATSKRLTFHYRCPYLCTISIFPYHSFIISSEHLYSLSPFHISISFPAGWKKKYLIVCHMWVILQMVNLTRVPLELLNWVLCGHFGNQLTPPL